MTSLTTLDPLIWLDQSADGVDVRVLLERREWVVPFAGAGISRGAGVPMSADLAGEMLGWPDAPTIDPASVNEADVRSVADAFVGAGMDVVEIKRRIAEKIRGVALVESPTIRAVGRVPSRLVITLNWDGSIEQTMEAGGVSARSIVLHPDAVEDALDAIRDPGAELSVVHVHGFVEAPETLVLEAAAYDRLWDSRAVAAFFTVLIRMRRLCFMGTKLDELQILNAIFEGSLGGKDHVFLGDADMCREVTTGRASISQLPRLLVRSYPNSDGSHAALTAVAEYIAEEPPSVVIPHEPKASAAPAVEDIFVPPTLVPTDGTGEEDELVQSFLVAAGERDPLTDADLVRVGARTVIAGAPGSGKSTLLRRLGAEADDALRPVLIRLSTVSAVGEPPLLLERWAEAGEGLRGDEPVGSEALEHRSFLFLLDGLDEVPLAEQERLAVKIVQLARAHPVHSFTVASRPVGALSMFSPPEWQHVSLATGPEWRHAYLEARGTTWNELVATLPELDDLRDLLDIPFFLSAVVDLHEEGHLADAGTFPQVVERLVRGALDASGIPLAPDAALDWLRRVSVALLLSERTDATVDELAQVELPTQLQNAGEMIDVCGLLVTARVFAGRGEGRFGFIHRIVGESLASQFLTDHAPDDHGLIDAVAPCVGERLCGVRSDWLVTVTLAATRDSRWRTAIRSRDALAAARTVPADASLDERREAARTIWSQYERWRIWIWDYREPSLIEDAEVLARLLRTPGMEPMRNEIVTALDSQHREVRGNAIRVLALVGEGIVEQFIRRTLESEEDTTLRRVAAVSAGILGATRLFHLVAHRAMHPAEDVEAQDMTLVAGDLATVGELLPFALQLANAPGGSPYLIASAVRHRLPERDELRFFRAWAHADVSVLRGDKERLGEIVGALDPADEEAARDVGFVAAAWKMPAEVVGEYISAHPESALSGMLTALEEGVAYNFDLAAFVDSFPSAVLEAGNAPEEMIRWKRERVESAQGEGEVRP